MKTDKSLHDICIAAIKRSTIKPYDFKWTKFYVLDYANVNSEFEIDLIENELLICSTIIDAENYSILTTRRLLTKIDGKLDICNIAGAIDKFYGDFKGYKDTTWTFGKVKLLSGVVVKYFIEVGSASMIMIHGVKTLIRTTEMTNIQIENVTRVWSKHNKE